MPDSRGVPPKKNGGRFIPCRGGGTATTYYTDYHSVDEDMTAISVCSGYCRFDSMTGVTYRSMNDATTNSGDDAASRCRHLRKSLIIRMHMMSTKK